MKRLIALVASFIIFIGCWETLAQPDLLRSKIEKIIDGKNAVIGVSIIGNNGQDTISLNGDRHCPLQSVFKMHIALAVLSEIDKGNLALQQEVDVKMDELLPEDYWSPLRDENPNGGRFTIAKLIQYAVSQSDNVACDVLIRLIGNPKTVEEYFRKNGINDIEITFTEEEMQSKWENMFDNWTTPKAASETLQKFYENKNLLSQNSYDFFWKTMRETITGAKRLRRFLPEGTIIAHKTGTSGTNTEGLTPATNDIGIVFFPDGKYFIISVFITDSRESFETNETLIADIAKATYDYYSEKTDE